MNQQSIETQTSYDRIAGEYARQIYGELAGKPLDRALLDRFAERLRGRGVVCDMGCGPGQIGRYLAARGLPVVGLDLSPGMVAQAAALNPDITFRAGDMGALDEPDGAWAGIAAFYSIIHIPPGEVVAALTEMRRVLQPGGLLLLAFHIGDEVVRPEEMMGQPVALDFWFYTPGQMSDWLAEAGYTVEEIIEREPYAPEVEHQSRRAYVLAKKWNE
jgi:SAM-dependent methyltransferase